LLRALNFETYDITVVLNRVEALPKKDATRRQYPSRKREPGTAFACGWALVYLKKTGRVGDS